MKSATLLHNPEAGNEAYTKKELKSKIKAEGFKSSYSSTKKKGWGKIDSKTDFIIVAGGDGTVGKVAIKLLDKKLNKKHRIALLPLGTANNIAKTLGITAEAKEVIQSWHDKKLKKFDVGRIRNLPSAKFFLESFGYGVFPLLMQEMKHLDEKLMNTPEKKLDVAIKLLQEIILSYEPPYCKLEINGTDHSGKFLLVEIMNTQSIGPNLVLSPNGNPGDGVFEVVLIAENQKRNFLSYILSTIKETKQPYPFDVIKAKNVRIKCNEPHCHVDDELVKIRKETEVRIKLMEGMLEFMVQ